MAYSLSQCRVDRVLADVALDTVVVRLSPLILGERSSLKLVLMSSSPRACQNLSRPPHSLRIGRHNTDCSNIMQNVLCRDGLFSDAVLEEGGVIGVVPGKTMAVGSHINVLVNRVCRERHGRSRAAGEHIRVFDQLDHIGGMTSAGAFDVIDVNATALEDCSSVFEEASLVKAISMDMALNILLFADAADGSQNGSTVTFLVRKGGVTYFRQLSIVDGVQPKSSCSFSATTPALI